MPRSNRLDVVVICGSLREGSYNAMLARALPELAPESMTIRFAPSFESFPLYNADIQEREGFPPEVAAFGEALREADGVVIITPEYNFSIPGGLKNALDWVSRLKDQPFRQKPVAVQSASPSQLGGGRAQYHLRQVMVYLDALVLNQPEVLVAQAPSKVNETTGNLTDEATRTFVREQLEAFASFIEQVSEPRRRRA